MNACVGARFGIGEDLSERGDEFHGFALTDLMPGGTHLPGAVGLEMSGQFCGGHAGHVRHGGG